MVMEIRVTMDWFGVTITMLKQALWFETAHDNNVDTSFH